MTVEERRTPEALALAEAVRVGFARSPRQLDPKYFYDPLGSSLFEAICRLPWYRITRAETALLATHAEAIARRFAGAPVALVELGVGSGEKLLYVAEALHARAVPAQVHLVDVSTQALTHASERLERFNWPVAVHPTAYEDGLARALSSRARGVRTLVLFLGSNLGNFDAPVAEAFLRQIGRLLSSGDCFLLGADLVKPEADLLLAYDDPLGVTAAFNRNILVRINRELEANFDLNGFVHRAVWNAGQQRIEMQLVSTEKQHVIIPIAGVEATFAEDDYIWTESSHKYEPEQIESMGAAAGFCVAGQWIDPDARFALTLFEI